MMQVKAAIDGKGKQLIATMPISEGETFYKMSSYKTIAKPTYTSIQISYDSSIEDYACLANLNHSCDPNVIVDTTRMELKAARDIQPGDELSFFYPSTEWDMTSPFICLCGASNCLRLIAGAKYLSLDVMSRYFINRHIGVMALECLTHREALKSKGLKHRELHYR
ncbi:SET domain-containing protein-lysine N-methyltransferase [Leptolyngbya sp. GB1-A1]|uniref:SET domain-containing protein-lysine N-methyltransferase n=1 Tax=Leptolyngbya sp. GB1-A1 TaxID=2933908 RepID=UPI003297ED83